MDNEREMIQEALAKFWLAWYPGNQERAGNFAMIDFDALAEQAIVIECEVEHDWLPETGVKTTLLEIQGCAASNKANICLVHEHIGTPGKAIAIIVPLEEDDKDTKGF